MIGRVVGLLVGGALGLLSACASPAETAPQVVSVRVETTEPIAVSSPSGRVAVEVKNGNTTLALGEARFVCKGYSGYIGGLAPEAGWVRVGRISITWDRARATVRSRKDWATWDLAPDLALWVHQDGRMGRSVFRD